MNNLKNDLPEWAKASPVDQDDNDFSVDFGHPDAPRQIKQRIVSDNDINLNAIQMFDVVHGKGVIGLIDRRSGGRKEKKQEVQQEKNLVSKLREKMEAPPKEEEKKEEIVAIGGIVLMVKEKIVGSGSLDDISEVVLTLIKDNPELSDDDFVLFKRIGLDIVLEHVNDKY